MFSLFLRSKVCTPLSASLISLSRISVSPYPDGVARAFLLVRVYERYMQDPHVLVIFVCPLNHGQPPAAHCTLHIARGSWFWGIRPPIPSQGILCSLDIYFAHFASQFFSFFVISLVDDFTD